MPMNIWNKYKKIKEISSNSKIKTYSVRIEPIIKEIIPKDIGDYYLIKDRLTNLSYEFKIYEIIEEGDRIFAVIDNNEELNLKIDKLVLSDELEIQKEGIIQGHGNPISKKEMKNLFEMEKSICKISYENIENNKLIKGKETGFFCKMPDNCQFKYALFTNNHVLNNTSIEVGNNIYIEYYERDKQIEIAEKYKKISN